MGDKFHQKFQASLQTKSKGKNQKHDKKEMTFRRGTIIGTKLTKILLQGRYKK